MKILISDYPSVDRKLHFKEKNSYLNQDSNPGALQLGSNSDPGKNVPSLNEEMKRLFKDG